MNKFYEAAEVYRREVAFRPDDSDAWYGMGLCFEHVGEGTAIELAAAAKESSYNQRLVGRYQLEQDMGIDAEETFRRALAQASPEENEGLYADLGYAHLLLGQLKEAGDEFGAELRLHPGCLDGKLGLAAVSMERQDWTNAFRQLCDIDAADPGFFQTHLDFLLAMLKEPTVAKAVDALGTNSSPEKCSATLGRVREELTSAQPMMVFGNAFEDTTSKAPKLRPAEFKDVSAAHRASEAGHYAECAQILGQFRLRGAEEMLSYARCNCLAGRFLAALEVARSVTNIDHHNAAALYWQAEAARKLAQAAFQRGVSLSPNSWQGQVLLGDILRQRKQWDLAISRYEEAARLKPESPAPFLGLGTVYWQTGRNDQAEAALRKALELEPDNALTNFVLGDIYVRKHRFEDAVPLLNQSLAHHYDLLAVHADLGKAFAALNQNEEAIAELQRALPMDQFGDIHYQLYVLYKKQGETKLAQEALAESERLRALEAERHQERTDRASENSRRNSKRGTDVRISRSSEQRWS